MAFQLSPGVLVTEKDLTSVVPAVSTSVGGYAGAFVWGPVLEPTMVASENELVQRFGKPNSTTAASFFTAANFLAYSSSMYIVRAAAAGARNAVATPSGSVDGVTIAAPVNGGSGYVAGSTTVSFSAPDISGGVQATGTVVVSNDVVVGQTPTFTVSGVTITNGGTGYGSPLITFTAAPVGGVTATATLTVSGGVITAVTITNPGSGYTTAPTFTINLNGGGGSAFAGTVVTAAGTPLNIEADGVVTGITITNPGSGYTSPPVVTVSGAGSGFTGTAVVTLGGIVINNEDSYINSYVNGAGVVGLWAAKYPGALGNSLKVSMADSATYTGWAYAAEFDRAPSTSDYAASGLGTGDELHVIVIDEDGLWTGVQGGILEKFAFVSKASDAKKSDGTNNYYRDVININSKYVWWMDHPTAVVGSGNWGSAAAGVSFKTLTSAQNSSLAGGIDDNTPSAGNLQSAFALLANSEAYDLSLIPTGPVTDAVAKYVVQNVADVRKDCVVFCSPSSASGGPITGSTIVADTVTWRNAVAFNVNSSYAVLDSGWKYQYDRYNDQYRWVPLNGDVAGVCARTDYTNDPWWSPGGVNRGQIKNVVRLNVNPNQAERDALYKAGVNPVVSFPGQGTVLYGDKTLLQKPSAFDRINVRRLFIVLEKAIATAAKSQLFEFNDSFTRAQFRALVEPFLRDVQGRRGVTDFRVKCDETNNTAEVIDRNEFVADIFIKPTRSINFITLNFVAARSAISFEEIGG